MRVGACSLIFKPTCTTQNINWVFYKKKIKPGFKSYLSLAKICTFLWVELKFTCKHPAFGHEGKTVRK